MKTMRIARAFLPAAALAAALAAASCAPRRPWLLTGEVTDAGSGTPVYGAEVRFGGRSTRLFLSRGYRLTLADRQPGLLTVGAPGYEEVRREVVPRGKETRVDIALRGKEVPGLAGILVWGDWEEGALRLEVRLVDGAGAGIEHFPALPFEARVRISENRGSADGPRRGAVLYEGRPALSFDPESRLEKLHCRIGAGELGPAAAGIATGMLDFVLRCPSAEPGSQGEYGWSRGDLPLRPAGPPGEEGR